MVCPECGTQMSKGSRFCHQCGWDKQLAAAGRSSSTAQERPAWKRWTMGITLGFSVLLTFMLLLIPRTDAAASLLPGQAAPDFELVAQDGTTVRLSSLKGQPVILNFWATWCTPCRREMPDLQKLYDQYRAAGLQVYGINVGESKVSVNDFVQQVGTKFPILIDRQDKIQTEYKILPLPTTFFIDRDGVIRAAYPYQMSWGQMESEAIRLLSK